MSRPLTKEEFEAVNKDLSEVLEKHDCEILVEAKMLVLKRGDVNVVEPMPETGIPTPFIVKKDGESGTTIEDPKA